jgi:tRNA-specific 2-thiouridylase
MSGGVDSSVAAYLLKQQGYSCIGATMKLFDNEDVGESRENSCCSLDDIEDARSVARALGIPHYVLNFTHDFRAQVIDRFVSVYQNGATPNPCIDCNRYMKFEKLLLRARQLNLDYLATGHYATIEHDSTTERYLLKKARDRTKDQSYFLASLTQQQLTQTLFPLGTLLKSEVREIATTQGFTNAEKTESQDICFVLSGGYADFILQYTGVASPVGRFVGADGNDLGEHQGIIHYTIGQRKGLGIAVGEPLYVCAINASENTVTLGTHDQLYTHVLTARDINLIAVERIDTPLRVRARVRYRQEEQPATVWQLDSDTLRIEFDDPQHAVALGQTVVMYDGDVVIGGGTID